MNGLWWRAQTFRCTVQRLDVLGFPDCCRQISPDYLLLFSPPESGHEQDSPAHSGFAQGDAFIGGGYAQPFCSGRFKSQRAFGGPVTIGVRLDHGANLNVGADHCLHCLKIAAQCLQ